MKQRFFCLLFLSFTTWREVLTFGAAENLHGSELIWLSLIRIGNADLDPRTKKLAKINKETVILAFQKDFGPLVQCCGSGMFIPDPDPDFLPIPDPGSRGQKGT